MNPSTDIRSHSSMLYNLEVSNLLSELNHYGKALTGAPDGAQGNNLRNVYSTLRRLWVNVRSLIRAHKGAREGGKLEVSRLPGVYTPDIMLRYVGKRLMTVTKETPLTKGEAFELSGLLESVEVIIRESLQRMQYFGRFEFKSKPDISAAAEMYKQDIDALTEEQLENLAGNIEQKILKLTEAVPEDMENVIFESDDQENDD